MQIHFLKLKMWIKLKFFHTCSNITPAFLARQDYPVCLYPASSPLPLLGDKAGGSWVQYQEDFSISERPWLGTGISRPLLKSLRIQNTSE